MIYVTNLKAYPVGIDGVIKIPASAVDFAVDDSNKDLAARVAKLVAASKVKVRSADSRFFMAGENISANSVVTLTALTATATTRASRTDDVVTLTVASHPFSNGDVITVTGLTNTTLNGANVVITSSTATTILYTKAGDDVTDGADTGGSIAAVSNPVRAYMANATNNTKPAEGFVVAATSKGATALVQFNGIIAGQTGLTPGQAYFLSASSNGAITATAPTGAGKIVQVVGSALSATELLFSVNTFVVLLG